jgi:hypothetical protein
VLKIQNTLETIEANGGFWPNPAVRISIAEGNVEKVADCHDRLDATHCRPSKELFVTGMITSSRTGGKRRRTSKLTNRLRTRNADV